jgi:hypothetical protein
VPDGGRPHAARRGGGSQAIDRCPPNAGQRPSRVNLRPNRVAMMCQKQSHP